MPPPDRIEEVVVADLRQRWSIPSVWMTTCGSADGAVAIEVLVEGGLEGFQRGAVARDRTDQVRQVVAVAVGAPHRVEAAELGSFQATS